MPSAEKRARKKENARAAQMEREAALKRKKRTRSIITVAVVVAIFAAVIVLLSTGGDDKEGASATTTPVTLPEGCTSKVPPQTEKKLYEESPPKIISVDPQYTYYANVDTTCGEFTMALNIRDAPRTSNSFVYLARHKFYDGLKFHRVAKDFVVQGGDPEGNGKGGAGYNLPDEPPKYGYREGTVAMANSSAPNSSSSQFFIVLNDKAGKDLESAGTPFKYSALGQVTKNFDVVKKLGSLYNRDQDPADSLTQKTAVPLYINKITITRVPPEPK
jgi:cyclophilin family peptidyl-prolyl cis-trans isomerase